MKKDMEPRMADRPEEDGKDNRGIIGRVSDSLGNIIHEDKVFVRRALLGGAACGAAKKGYEAGLGWNASRVAKKAARAGLDVGADIIRDEVAEPVRTEAASFVRGLIETTSGGYGRD